MSMNQDELRSFIEKKKKEGYLGFGPSPNVPLKKKKSKNKKAVKLGNQYKTRNNILVDQSKKK